ncbi:MAG: ribonuclease P protein component [Clostridia bacterium]
MKRLLRENYKNLEEKLEKGYSIVFLIKKDVDTDEIDYQKIKKDMNKIFKKAEIIVLE